MVEFFVVERKYCIWVKVFFVGPNFYFNMFWNLHFQIKFIKPMEDIQLTQVDSM